LQKRPINLVKSGFRYLNSHISTNGSVAADMTALLHFKFCGELKRRFEMKSEGNHYRRGLSYMQLEDAVASWTQSSLCYPGSCQFRTSADLLAVGLIGTAPSKVWTDCQVKSIRTSKSGPHALK